MHDLKAWPSDFFDACVEGGQTVEDNDLKQIETMMSRVVGVFPEDIQHKLDILVEGQQMLGERMDRLEGRVVSVGDYRQSDGKKETDHAHCLKNGNRSARNNRGGQKNEETRQGRFY